MSHYNDKKQLLQESQVEVAELKHSLDVKEREFKAVSMENKLLQLDLDKAQGTEKTLLSKLASLEAQVGRRAKYHCRCDGAQLGSFPFLICFLQLAFADQNLRAQNKIHGNERSESCYLEVPNGRPSVHTTVPIVRNVSSDSLDQSSLEDSLNNTR